ncbi:hypothetical protein Q4E93_17585 [Flavitalea sp. BT771]|uniref:hypothetical protein n=1 Tax=Flavitalea sp. BT771 TaxID=3063329 RepID=UPI0026E45753|nr:hypothetical protein [Flavitalea sp. BT771]MDO6432420.1 hypothetical protein [Flavitalea sp. BT771]MDV6221330.1 hypothetical protein [Flavitalea sp. BT771]
MSTAVSVYPNPFDRFIEIELTCAEDRDCIILLANLKDNRIIRMLGAGLEKGVNKIPLGDLQSLQLGSYQLDIKDPTGDTIYKTMLVKQ